MAELEDGVDRIATETGFSGVVRVDEGGQVLLAKAYGLAHRGLRVPNTVDTRFAIASGGKGPTALVVVSLIEEGLLDLATPARSLLGSDLPLIADDVTVEHLLADRSGIGDYLDEEGGWEVNDYALPVPVHRLVGPEDFLPILDGYPTVFPAGERFAYCNGGFVVLAVLAERAAGVPYAELVRERVCQPAGMGDTAFLRSDEPDERMALGYLGPTGLRTNALHLPVVGSADGGIYSTVADLQSFWSAFTAGAIVPPRWVDEMVRPRSDAPDEGQRYGLGFWLHPTGDGVVLIGFDAGVSFRSAHDPATMTTYTVISNTSSGAWPLARHLDPLLLSP